MKRNQSKKPTRASEIFAVNLRGLMAVQDVNASELWMLMGISRPTFYRRLKKPYEFTMDNVERAAKRFGVTPADMLGKVMTVREGVA